jgi:plasmid stability protein
MIRLELSDEDHAALRVVAAKAGMSMAAYVRSLVSRHVRKEIEKPDER